MNIVIPNLGDIEEVEIIELCVEPGDVVEVNDTLVVIESDKASMEIPSTVAGTVMSFEVAVGDTVAEGDLIAKVEEEGVAASDGGDTDAVPKTAQASVPEPGPVQEATHDAPPSTDSTSSSSEIDVLVPDIGDAGEVVVIEVAVKPGDEIDVDDLLVVLESDKASMEIAAEHAGTVVSVMVEEGHEVQQGTHIATLKVAQTSQSAVVESPAPVASPPEMASSDSQPSAQPAVAPQVESTDQSDAARRVYAGPAVRRLARELGVDLTKVTGTGNRQRITKDDVKSHVKARLTGEVEAGSGGWPAVPQIDFSKFGPTSLLPLTRIQQRGADNLHRSWVNLPHVTQHDEADITDLEEFRQSLKKEAERKGIKVTPLAFIIKACCHALKEDPKFNSSLHADGKQLVIKDYINIGMAVDTPEGLVVPVIKNANEKNIWQLSQEVVELSDKARNKKLGIDDMQGGTFSVSSLGAIGGTGFTPIVNAPEVAILGVAKLQTKPLWDGSNFVPRKVLPLSLSYDHRVINGADGGRFITYLAALLSDLRRLAL